MLLQGDCCGKRCAGRSFHPYCCWVLDQTNTATTRPSKNRRFLEEDAAGGLLPVAGSLAVRELNCDTHMHIDQGTAAALELIQPTQVGTCSTKLTGMTLFRCVQLCNIPRCWWSAADLKRSTAPSAVARKRCRVLDRTKTKCGARLLRANLLQPLRDIATLRLRYDAVAELLEDCGLALSTSTCLAALPKDLDKCGSLLLSWACLRDTAPAADKRQSQQEASFGSCS